MPGRRGPTRSSWYTDLDADPKTRELISALRCRGRNVACHDSTVPTALNEPTSRPKGATCEWDLWHRGHRGNLKRDFPAYAKDAPGIYTFAFKDGNWSFDYLAYNGGKDHQTGIYRADGDDLYWLWDPCCSHPNPVLHLKWSVDGSRTLHFTLVSGPADWALALPFPRIGDVK